MTNLNSKELLEGVTPGPWRVHIYNEGHLLGFMRGGPLEGQRYGDPVVLKFAKPTSERNKPTLGKREALATPLAFRDALLDLACASRAERLAA